MTMEKSMYIFIGSRVKYYCYYMQITQLSNIICIHCYNSIDFCIKDMILYLNRCNFTIATNSI